MGGRAAAVGSPMPLPSSSPPPPSAILFPLTSSSAWRLSAAQRSFDSLLAAAPPPPPASLPSLAAVDAAIDAVQRQLQRERVQADRETAVQLLLEEKQHALQLAQRRLVRERQSRQQKSHGHSPSLAHWLRRSEEEEAKEAEVDWALQRCRAEVDAERRRQAALFAHSRDRRQALQQRMAQLVGHTAMTHRQTHTRTQQQQASSSSPSALAACESAVAPCSISAVSSGNAQPSQERPLLAPPPALPSAPPPPAAAAAASSVSPLVSFATPSRHPPLSLSSPQPRPAAAAALPNAALQSRWQSSGEAAEEAEEEEHKEFAAACAEEEVEADGLDNDLADRGEPVVLESSLSSPSSTPQTSSSTAPQFSTQPSSAALDHDHEADSRSAAAAGSSAGATFSPAHARLSWNGAQQSGSEWNHSQRDGGKRRSSTDSIYSAQQQQQQQQRGEEKKEWSLSATRQQRTAGLVERQRLEDEQLMLSLQQQQLPLPLTQEEPAAAVGTEAAPATVEPQSQLLGLLVGTADTARRQSSSEAAVAANTNKVQVPTSSSQHKGDQPKVDSQIVYRRGSIALLCILACHLPIAVHCVLLVL